MGDIPRTGRLAGIDFGTVRIGIAVSDPQQILATPLENYACQDESSQAARFLRLVADEQIVGFVIGLPVHASGDESQKSQEARRFGQWLGDLTEIPVGFHDERYTSVQADQALSEAGMSKKKRKQRRDMIAAQIILASYLDANRDAPPPQSLG